MTLPQGLKSIGSRAFALCYGLTEIEIPGSVQIISPGAFSACSELNISVNDSNRNYSSIDGVLFSKDEKRLIAYTKDWIVPNYTVPSGVERIENQAFASCRYLKSVEIPTGVTEIGRQAFSACTEMTRITLPHTLELIENSAFNSTRKLTDVYYDGSYEEWNYIEARNSSLGVSNLEINYNTKEYSMLYGYINGQNKVRVYIEKEDENVNGGILVAVSYANDRKIIDTAFAEIGEIPSHSNRTIDIVLKTEGAKFVRTFIWDGKDKLRPMSRYIKFTMD